MRGQTDNEIVMFLVSLYNTSQDRQHVKAKKQTKKTPDVGEAV